MSKGNWSEEDRCRFIGHLNEQLPTKRVIAQGVLRNERDEVLLCELTYKREWDLPGGVVDKGESPLSCLARECSEELGQAPPIRGLLTTTWLPPYRGWDDAVLFLFDLGRVSADWIADLTLQPREIVAVHWCAPEVVAERAAGYTTELLHAVSDPAIAPYLERPDPAGG